MERPVIAFDADFSVVDESEDWIVVNKPAPLIVHKTNDYRYEPTLIDGVAALLAYECVNGAKLSLVHRLDRETSGLVLIAKHKAAARELSMAMERREVEKEYWVLVFGVVTWQRKTVRQPIMRKGEITHSPIWVKQMVHPEGSSSETVFERLSVWRCSRGDVTLLRARPMTGRMHQIRVHAAHCGYPLVGDKIYGVDETCYLRFMEQGWTAALADQLWLPCHALCSARLRLPYRGECLEWSIGVPDRWQVLMGTRIDGGDGVD